MSFARLDAMSGVHTHACGCASELQHSSVCARHAWAECKHIGRLPVWVAQRGAAPARGREVNERSGERETLRLMPTLGGEKEERQPRGNQMRRQRDVARTEEMSRQSEEQTSRLG